jgi:NADPH2:quinone reductase
VGTGGLIPVPPELDLPDAVALLADGRTAMGIIRAAALQPGEWVLVESAAGGVGSLLVQLASNAGAHVIAVAGSQRKLDLAADLGAKVTADYTDADWADQVREAIGNASARAGVGDTGDRMRETGGDTGVQVVLDGVGGDIGRSAFELVAPRGRFLMFGAASGTPTHATVAEVSQRGVVLITGGQMFQSPADIKAMAEAALAEAAAGRIRPVIGQTFPLEQAADAHAAIEARTTLGKTLLIP